MMPSLYTLIILFIFPLMGGILAYYTHKEWKKTIKLFISFSGAFLFSITLLNFIPEVYGHSSSAGYWVLGGFLFQVLIERLTHGVEHGHEHSHIKNIAPLFLGLSIHAFLEGIPVGSSSIGDNNIKNGLLYGVALHEMPAAFVLVLTLKNKIKSTKIFKWILFYALICPLGAWVGFSVENAEKGHELIQPLLAFVTGTFLHISTTILFENSEDHKMSFQKVFAVLIGASLAILTGLMGSHHIH